MNEIEARRKKESDVERRVRFIREVRRTKPSVLEPGPVTNEQPTLSSIRQFRCFLRSVAVTAVGCMLYGRRKAGGGNGG